MRCQREAFEIYESRQTKIFINRTIACPCVVHYINFFTVVRKTTTNTCTQAGGILEGKQDLWFKTNIAVCSRKRLTEIKTPDALLLTGSLFCLLQNVFVTFVASINTSSVDTVLEIVQLSRFTSVLGNLLPLRPKSMRNKNRKTKVLPEIDLKLIWSIWSIPVSQSPSCTADRHRRTLGLRLSIT